MADNAELSKFINECREVRDGRRGWASAKKSRAALCGITVEALHRHANFRGCVVEKHGKYGYVACRPRDEAGNYVDHPLPEKD
ncbi:hypothetical protein [Methylosinus sp. PW1]|uniref:hypothetical protein n=1 Tax=Methylosinus sp. PW1 TaxID=107636 RepID=UPI0018DCDF02|nr:hypothetical protein [Methylosinus sp. PW1]